MRWDKPQALGPKAHKVCWVLPKVNEILGRDKVSQIQANHFVLGSNLSAWPYLAQEARERKGIGGHQINRTVKA